jgi:hypothetical protein
MQEIDMALCFDPDLERICDYMLNQPDLANAPDATIYRHKITGAYFLYENNSPHEPEHKKLKRVSESEAIEHWIQHTAPDEWIATLQAAWAARSNSQAEGGAR